MALITCRCCGTVVERDGRGNPQFCGKCSVLQMNECVRAAHKVHAAVRAGLLPKVTDCKCKDCGAGAKFYDHRDYTKPLDVDPVCGRCNSLRGPALNSRMRQMEAA